MTARETGRRDGAETARRDAVTHGDAAKTIDRAYWQAVSYYEDNERDPATSDKSLAKVVNFVRDYPNLFQRWLNNNTPSDAWFIEYGADGTARCSVCEQTETDGHLHDCPVMGGTETL